MKRLSIKNLLSSTILASLFSGTIAHDYLANTERGDLFTKSDFSVAQFYMTIDKNDLNSLIESSNIIYENEELEVKVKGKLKIDVNGEEESDDKTTFSIGGQSTRGAEKLNFNIKMDKKHFGRKNLRLRSALHDPSFLRVKLSTDIINRLGLKSISSNYADVFINNDYTGFYVLIDAYKNSWLKEYYKLKNDPNYQFYQCKVNNCDLTVNNAKFCISDNESDILPVESDDPEILGENIPLLEFVNAINEKKTLDQLKEFMDVDAFIKSWIFEWLIGSVDHMLVNGKNYYLLRFNGMWTPLLYDFDTTFGVDFDYQLKERYGDKPAEVAFEDWYENRYIVDFLTKGDNESLFLKHLQTIIDEVFNPDLLIPHIDDLKEFIDPYVKKDRTPNEDGVLPGRINVDGYNKNEYNYDDFVKNSEYTKINNAEGIKQWIVDRYTFVCDHYDIKCNTKPISTNGRCGPKFGTQCPSGQCCSEKGYCGTTVSFCSPRKKCQSDYGSCTDPTKVSTNGRCGPDYGICPSDQCCSKKGYCGTTNSFCSASKGCQKKYGKCDISISTNGRCGSKYGTTCPSGQCCSEKGYCGTTVSFCSLNKNCQSDYGSCTDPTKVSTNGRCGPDYGVCPSGQCCSKKGYCGTSSAFCDANKGCQTKYGICTV